MKTEILGGPGQRACVTPAQTSTAKPALGPVTQGSKAVVGDSNIASVQIRDVPVPSVPEMGKDPVDAMGLAANVKTAFLTRSVVGAKTLAELISGGPHQFSQSPDPTPSLQATHHCNQLKAGVGRPLKVATLNVALLDSDEVLRPYARVIDRAYQAVTGWLGKRRRLSPNPSPQMEARRQRMGEAIFNKGDDVILLQEVWSDGDAALMKGLAQRFGYVAVLSPRDHHSDGLMTFIKRSAIDSTHPIDRAQGVFAKQKLKERLFSRVSRGYQVVSFHHPQMGQVNLINSHTTPFLPDWKLRLSQSRELGIVARNTSEAGGLTLLGGDLNAAPFYGVADWQQGGAPTSDQMHSALGAAVMQAYGGLEDVVVAGQPVDEVTADVRLGRVPPAADELPRYPFSADRTNPLNASQYGTAGSLSRLDFIYAVASPRWKAMHSEMDQTDNIPGQTFPLSDHYGFSATLNVAGGGG